MKLNELMEKYGDYEVKEGFMELLEKPKPKTVWDLKIGDEYWFIDEFGVIWKSEWTESDHDIKRRNQGNVFLTKEEVKFEQIRREVYAIVKKHSYEFSKEEWENASIKKWFPTYSFTDKKINYGGNYHLKDNILYFKSESDIQKAIDEIGEDDFIKYYLGIKNYE